MDWEEALNLVVQTTGHARYRDLCAEEHPDHDRWRALMIERATGEAPTPATYPGLATMASNAVKAAGRAVAAAVKGERVKATPEEQERRMTICRACSEWSEADGRCRACGCVGRWKTALQTEGCPLGKW